VSHRNTDFRRRRTEEEEEEKDQKMTLIKYSDT
jgi:hypothetical protein